MTGRGPVVVVSPHLDDAVLSAWLVLRSRAGVRVVTCFAGAPPAGVVGTWDSRNPGSPSVASRRVEDRHALSLTRSVPVHLDALDVQYRSSPVEETTDRVARLLGAELRDAEEVWLPAALGAHVDHRIARDAALRTVPRRARRFVYADLPYAGQPAWPARLTRGPRDAAVQLGSRALRRPAPIDHWRAVLAELPGAEGPRVTRLTPEQRREKLQAVDAYQSQLASLRCAPRNRLRRRRIFAYEVSWALPSDD